MASRRLPEELIAHILYSYKVYARDLCFRSLVAHSWTRRHQALLFETVYIGRGELHRWHKLLSSLDISPHLRPYVHRIILNSSFTSHSIGYNNFKTLFPNLYSVATSDGHFDLNMLDLFSHVRSLDVRRCTDVDRAVDGGVLLELRHLIIDTEHRDYSLMKSSTSMPMPTNISSSMLMSGFPCCPSKSRLRPWTQGRLPSLLAKCPELETLEFIIGDGEPPGQSRSKPTSLDVSDTLHADEGLGTILVSTLRINAKDHSNILSIIYRLLSRTSLPCLRVLEIVIHSSRTPSHTRRTRSRRTASPRMQAWLPTSLRHALERVNIHIDSSISSARQAVISSLFSIVRRPELLHVYTEDLW
jgi:hypothetical protein